MKGRSSAAQPRRVDVGEDRRARWAADAHPNQIVDRHVAVRPEIIPVLREGPRRLLPQPDVQHVRRQEHGGTARR
eukprot:gene3394-biopygen11675